MWWWVRFWRLFRCLAEGLRPELAFRHRRYQTGGPELSFAFAERLINSREAYVFISYSFLYSIFCLPCVCLIEIQGLGSMSTRLSAGESYEPREISRVFARACA